MKRQWLITSFEPFLDRTENNSETVMKEISKLVSQQAWSFEFNFKVLPVEYDRCFPVMMEEIKALASRGISIEGILGLGEANEEFKLETQANNLDDVPNYPDNAGVVRMNKKIFASKSEDDVFPFRFPFEAFARIRKSIHAGYYVCNHLCALAAMEFASDTTKPYFGFIHVPRAEMGGVFSADVCAAMIVNSFKKL